MRVLILADTLFASREKPLLSQLEMGLADEGVQVFQAVPDIVARTMDPEVFAQRVTYSPRVPGVFRLLGVRRLIEALAKVERLDEPSDIDIVHVLGGAAWKLGQSLARELDAGLALEIWRRGMTQRVSQLKATDEDRITLLAPDTTVETALREAHRLSRDGKSNTIARKATINLATWGVLTSDARVPLSQDRALSFMIVGSGRTAENYHSLLQGIAPVIQQRPDTQIFCDAHAARQSQLWPTARRLKLLSNLSLVEDLESRRDLLLAGDFLLYPEAAGEQRSVLLSAMGAGVVVVAAVDRYVAMLKDNVTARLVDSAQAAGWQIALRDLLADVAGTRLLAARARAYVEQERKASAYIHQVLKAYDKLISMKHAEA
ncbi:MAG: hypothetical protein U0640_01815 [Phycisphaerales bacterium]